MLASQTQRWEIFQWSRNDRFRNVRMLVDATCIIIETRSIDE